MVQYIGKIEQEGWNYGITPHIAYAIGTIIVNNRSMYQLNEEFICFVVRSIIKK